MSENEIFPLVKCYFTWWTGTIMTQMPFPQTLTQLLRVLGSLRLLYSHEC